MDQFQYKKITGITALAATMTDFKYNRHSHQEYALGVTLRGIQQYTLAGKMQTSYPGGVMLFHPEQTHDGMARDRAGIDYVMLYIEPKVFLEALGQTDMFRFSEPVIYNTGLEQKIVNLSHAVLHGEDEAACDDMLLLLTQSFQPNAPCQYKKEDAFIRKAKEMIHNLPEGIFDFEPICLQLGISKFHFIRMFKAHEGITPYQYFINCKVEKAKEIIEETNDVYSAVAGCGFVDLTHFNKHFKRRYGLTPDKYITSIHHRGITL